MFLLSLWGMFFSAFVAATLFPAQSELVLAGLLAAGDVPPAWLIGAATCGNVLGSLVNWGLGRACHRFKQQRWFPVGPVALERASNWYRRYGRWSLLFSWAPVIGDPLTLAAGLLKEPLLSFLLLVSVAKLARYLVVAGVTLPFIG